MTSILILAAIVAVVLLVAVLLLKKRNAAQKGAHVAAVDQAESTVQAAGDQVPVRSGMAPAQHDAAGAGAGVVLAAEECSGARSAAAITADDASVAGAAASPAAGSDDESLVTGQAAVVPPAEKAADTGLTAAPVGAEGGRSGLIAQEDGAEQLIAEQPEAAREDEPVLVSETTAPAAFAEPESAAPGAESVAVPSPAPVLEIDAAEVPVDTVAAGGVFPRISLTLEAYSTRLNLLEENQRALLVQAMQRRDDQQRDHLQRELVLMNDKLALLADSYAAEMACYQQILEVLEQLQDDGGECAAATEALQQGEPLAAETLFARLSEQPNPVLAAQAAFHSGQLAECRVDLHTALHLYRRAVALAPENPQYLLAAGKTARSIYCYQEALAWLESLVKLSRENKDTDPVPLARAQGELAYTYVLSGQHQKAGPLYKESMSTLARILGQDHPELAASWYQLGELQETLGEYDKAVTLYKKSLAILEQQRGMEHPVLANILDKLASLCMELEMEKQAVPLYERLVRIREKSLRPTHPQLALSLNNLAESYRLQGQYAAAETCYRKSLAINETLHGLEHPSVAAVLQELAKLCFSQRKPAEAEQYQQRASAIFQMSVEASEQKTGQEALTLEL